MPARLFDGVPDGVDLRQVQARLESLPVVARLPLTVPCAPLDPVRTA